MLVLNLQPQAAIDYEAFNRLPDRTAMTGEWLAYCSACPVPEIANVFRALGFLFTRSRECSDDRIGLGGNRRMDRSRPGEESAR